MMRKRGLMVSVIAVWLLGVAALGCGNDIPEPPGLPEQNGEMDIPSNGDPGEVGEPGLNNEGWEDGEGREDGEDEAMPGDIPVQLDLYFMEVTETSFELGKETREFGKVGGPQVDLGGLVNCLLEGPETGNLSRAIPEGTRLRDVYLEYGTAYVDFSRELTEAHFGSEAEMVLVNSIVKTLTQLNEVEAVQILVEGEVIQSIAGHVMIDRPLK